MIFAAIWVLLYTSFGYHPEKWFAVREALTLLDRPAADQTHRRPLVLLHSRAGAVRAADHLPGARRGDRRDHRRSRRPIRFMRFVVVWGVGSLFIYAWAQEKVPWLLIPQLLPLTLLARALVRPASSRPAPSPRPAPALGTAAVGGADAVVAGRGELPLRRAAPRPGPQPPAARRCCRTCSRPTTSTRSWTASRTSGDSSAPATRRAWRCPATPRGRSAGTCATIR